MKSKKGLILTVATVLVVALCVGLSYAAWDKIGDNSTLDFTVGDRVDVTSVATQITELKPLYPTSSAIYQAKKATGSVVATQILGSFVPTIKTDTGLNVADFDLKHVISGVYMLTAGVADMNTDYSDVFKVVISTTNDPANIDAEGVFVGTNIVAPGDVLTNNATFYVYIMFNTDIESDATLMTKATQIASKQVQVKITINASAKIA